MPEPAESPPPMMPSLRRTTRTRPSSERIFSSQRRARLCRRTLVAPSRTSAPNSGSSGGGTSAGSPSTVVSMSAERRIATALSISVARLVRR
ncbi:hypothetical protein ACFQ0O_01995 [Saccharopolyspora spinosporotrichia]